MGRQTLYYYVALACIACAGIPKGKSFYLICMQ